MAIETRNLHRSFGGTQGFYTHDSEVCGGPMTFSVFVPAGAEDGARAPVVTYLSGLTCTEENVTSKGGFQRVCAELGLIFVAPDTSPRGAGYPGEDESYDFGTGAGFYLDATLEPWAKRYRMYSYITQELPAVIEANFPVDMSRQGITGHSMGGHGALTIALKNPERFRSVSAFAPIVAPTQVPWGHKAFAGYLGEDRSAWLAYDACELVKSRGPLPHKILIDQGGGDSFLAEQLRPELFEAACETAGQEVAVRLQPGYDHSYYFISTFMEEHLRHHAAALLA